MKTEAIAIQSGEIYHWEEIIVSGLDTELFIKINAFERMDLQTSLVCHEQTYFPGLTFHHYPNTNKFIVEENNFSAEKAGRFNLIRNLEWDIESLENRIWTCKLEGNKHGLLQQLQDKLIITKNILLDIIKVKQLQQCA